MKAMKQFASVLALLLAVMMLFAACGPDEQTSEPTSSADDTQTSSVVSDESQPDDDVEESSSNTSNTQNNTSKQHTNNNTSKPQAQTGKQDAFNNANDATYLNTAPKGEVHVLMWRKFHKSEQLLVDQFKKLTGNNVKVTVTTESEYPTKLVSMVSGGNSPDVICFSAGNFPGLVTKSLQPLQNKYFQLDSDCWNKNYMDAYRINGVYFGVAQPQSWSCEDCTYVTYYSPQILKNCGITTTPFQLYKQGKWNWDKQAEIARAVKKKGFQGLSMQSFDLYMLSAGVDFAKYDGSKYTNQLGSVKGTSLLTQAWMEAAELKQEEVLTGWDLTNVQQGKVGLFTAISYGLYNEGNWFQNNFAKNLEAVPVAGPTSTTYTPVRPKVWGVPKKAKNPEGAAYFLRYFLDTSAFNFDSTFHNKQFGEVYKIITKTSAKKTVMHGWGVADYVESGTYSKICNALVATSPQNITNQLNSKKGSVQTGIARANKDLARIKK